MAAVARATAVEVVERALAAAVKGMVEEGPRRGEHGGGGMRTWWVTTRKCSQQLLREQNKKRF